MSCRLIQNIKHTCEYNAGGIKEIYLCDIRDFIGYRFKDDKLFNQCLVELINIATTDYIKLDTVNESNYTGPKDNGIYRQTLTTFVRSIDYTKTSNLLLSESNNYLVILRTTEGKTYSFGSDGGASINFTQNIGQLGEASGYSITITKNSIFPLFEIDLDNTQHITRIFNPTFNDKFN